MNKIIVLEGNMEERKRALKKIKSSFTNPCDVTIFDEKDHYGYVAQALIEMPCFSENKLFIIKELPKIEAPTESQARTKVLGHFKKLFPDIAAGNTLIFDNVGISGESFLKEVRKYGEVHVFKKKVNKAEGHNIINDYFKDKNILISHDVSQLLVDSLNLNGDEIDVDKLNLLITKFHHYIYEKNTITKEDAYAVCSSSKDFIIWSLYKILDEISSSETKYIGSAISLVNNFLEDAIYLEHEAVMIIKGMIWRYGLLLLAKNGVNNKMSQQEINQKISCICKLENHGKAYNIQMNIKMSDNIPVPEYSSKMINSVMNSYYGKAALSCYDYNQLLLIYYTLVKTILKIRSGCTESEIKIAMHIVITVICGAISKQNTIDGILEHNKMLYGINK